jgi:hypothetical protein
MKGDPYRIKALYPGHCARCGATIAKGAPGWYYPNGRTLLCMSDKCGGQAERDFAAARADEASYNGA